MLEVDFGIDNIMLLPVDEFLKRPKKDLRGDVIKIGFLLYSSENVRETSDIEKLVDILEWIHSASLIVDDIQDDSQVRRGKECLHRIYGVPCALNAANWMYFEAIRKINDLSLLPHQKFKIINLVLDVMSKAHQGQAIDIMTDISMVPREKVYELGMKAHDLKSGSLFSLALQLGALVADDNADLTTLDRLGREIGCSLQRFDDLGNFDFEEKTLKALEDLKLGRPTWPWMFISKYRSEVDYYRFKEGVNQLPETNELKKFLEETNIKNEAISLAKTLHLRIYDLLNEPFPGILKEQGLNNLRNILERVSHAYV